MRSTRAGSKRLRAFLTGSNACRQTTLTRWFSRRKGGTESMKEMSDFTDASELERQKRKLLEYLLEEEGIQLSKPEMIARRESSNRSLLSFAQQRLWFLHQ